MQWKTPGRRRVTTKGSWFWAKTQIRGLVGRLECERAERDLEFAERNVAFVTRHGCELLLASAASVSTGEQVASHTNVIASLAIEMHATRAQQCEQRASQRQAKQAKWQVKRDEGLRVSSTDEASRPGSPEEEVPQCGLG